MQTNNILMQVILVPHRGLVADSLAVTTGPGNGSVNQKPLIHIRD